MTKTDADAVVAVYSTHALAESAVKSLRQSGYDIRKLSIIVNDFRYEERIVGFYSASDRMRHWVFYGVLWGSGLGLLFGAALSIVPNVEFGFRVMVELLMAAMPGSLYGAATGGLLSAVTASLYSMTLADHSVLKYELSIEAIEECLLVAHTAAEAAATREIISEWRPVESRLPSHGSFDRTRVEA